MKKTFALLMAMLLSFAAPAAQVKAAGKKAVWVPDTHSSEFNKYQCTYNKNGLLVKYTCLKSNGGLPSDEYTYKGTKITKAMSDSGDNKTVFRYTYDKKGYLATQTPGGITDVEKFKWKNGRCVETADGQFSYNKNGWIRKADYSKIGSTTSWVNTFDKYGYIISTRPKSGEEYPGAYTYK